MEAKTTNGSIYALDPYASPDDVEIVAKQLKVEKPPIKIPQRFKLNPSLKFRTESFGGAVFADGKMRGLIDQEGLSIIAKMEKGRVYSLKDITSENNSFNIAEFVAGMYRNKIVRQKN